MTLFEFFTLLGGVGLFLYGMSLMSQGLKLAAGNKLRSILEHATANRFVAVAVGVLVTLLVQSSSATDMMVISFVNSGLMTLVQAIGVIMGANIGTTVTAQITAFNLSDYAPFILFIGAILYLFVKKNAIKYTGSIILGFGMLFFGISVIKSAMSRCQRALLLFPSFRRWKIRRLRSFSASCSQRCCRVPRRRSSFSRPLQCRDLSAMI